MTKTALIILFLAAAIGAPVQLRAQSGVAEDILARDFPYAASDVEIDRVIQDIGSMTGAPIVADADLDGRVTLSNAGGTVADALDEIATQVPIVWWSDGAALHVEPQSGLTSRLLPLGLVSQTELAAEMRALDLFDGRFPIRASSGGSFVRIVAPQGYVAETERLIAQMNRPRSRLICAPGEDGEDVEIAGLPRVLRGPDQRTE